MKAHLWFQLKAFFVKSGLVHDGDNDASQYMWTLPELNERWNKSLLPREAYVNFFKSYCSCSQENKIKCWDCKKSLEE